MNTQSTTQFKPQFIPYRCPKCNGHGSVNYGQLKCAACDGTGILKVPVANAEEEGEKHEQQ